MPFKTNPVKHKDKKVRKCRERRGSQSWEEREGLALSTSLILNRTAWPVQLFRKTKNPSSLYT